MNVNKAHFKHSVPGGIILSFSRLDIVRKLDIKLVQDRGRIDHFEGSPSEIVLYIVSAAILKDIISSLFADVIKSGVKMLWVSLSKFTWRKNVWRKIFGGKIIAKSITLIVSTSDKEIELVFKGFVTDSQAEKIIGDCLNLISSNTLDEIFLNPDYLDAADKPKIRLTYDFIEKVWKPDNFGMQRMRMKELMNAARRLSS
jgi:hypothetical protein